MIDEDDLAKIGLSSADIEGRSAQTAEEVINKARNAIFEITYSEQIKEAEKCK